MIKIVYAAIMVVVAFVLGLLTCILIQRQKQKRDQGKIQDLSLIHVSEPTRPY